MPIKKENKKLYPENWKDISNYIRFERAKNKCENCGIENYSMFFTEYKMRYFFNKTENCWISEDKHIHTFLPENIKIKKIVLTTAHLDHNPQNNDFDNLKALCQKCHNTYDRTHRNETIKKYNPNSDSYLIQLEFDFTF